MCVAENGTNGHHMGVFSVDVAFACHFVQLSYDGKMCALLLCMEAGFSQIQSHMLYFLLGYLCGRRVLLPLYKFDITEIMLQLTY